MDFTKPSWALCVTFSFSLSSPAVATSHLCMFSPLCFSCATHTCFRFHMISFTFPFHLKPILITEMTWETPPGQSLATCDAWQGDGVPVEHCSDGINASSRLMEGGSPACSLLSGASCNRAGEESFRLGGGVVIHVVNVGGLISAGESRRWFGCHLPGLCF